MKKPFSTLQKQLLHAIVAPINSSASQQGARLLNKAARLTAEESLAIYQHGYFARLTDCLAADFPLLKRFLGDEIFSKFSYEYLHQHPSQTPSLFNLGSQFPDFLKSTQPDVSQLSTSQQTLAQLPIELAAFERYRIESMRSEGVETQTTEQQNQINSIDYTQISTISSLDVKTPKTLRLMKSNFDLTSLAQQALTGNESIEYPAINESYLAISRHFYQLQLTRLDEWQFLFLDTATQQVSSIEKVVSSIAPTLSLPPEAIYARLTLWLPIAVAKGFITFQLIE
ncbi:MAG: DNA-binding domain-containing protein [Arenicella sp.]